MIERTVFVFTSDHGEEFWEDGRRRHGFSRFDEVLQVPLIVRDPPSDTRGEPSDAPEILGYIDAATPAKDPLRKRIRVIEPRQRCTYRA